MPLTQQSPGVASSPLDDVRRDASLDLIPVDKVQQARRKARVCKWVSAAGADLFVEVRRMEVVLAALLNQHAAQFSRLDGQELSRVVGIANAKLQGAMGWL